MAWLIWIPLLLPVALAAAAALAPRASWTTWAPPGAAVVALGTGVALIVTVRDSGPVTTAGGLLRADALAAYLLAVVGAVALTATWGAIRPRDPRWPPDGRFAALMCLFVAAMSLALLADNLGIMWVAVEATTITTAFLVGYRGGRHALEAAWKYVVLGSVGVAVAFLGIVLLYAATTASGQPTLSWAALVAAPGTLTPDLARVGVALAALGFATKAGLAPMHSWLPDAHSQAPAPVSALMSGVLLSVAFSAILRVQAVADAALGPGLMRGLLVAAGLLSLLVAAGLTLTQRDYKRMLAYSSIEHMGILALGAAVGGPLALAAVLLHVLGHGLAKASMFVLAGRILALVSSPRIADARSLLGRDPRIGAPFLAGMAALLGFPPFGLFFTEVAIVIAGWQAGLGWVMAGALVLLLLVFAGLSRHTLRMTLADHDAPPPSAEPETVLGAAHGPMVPVVGALAVVAVLGVLAWPLGDVLAAAVAALGGGS